MHCRVYDKAIPIPTQTDPINKTEHKSTSSQEVQQNAVSNLNKFYANVFLYYHFVPKLNDTKPISDSNRTHFDENTYSSGRKEASRIAPQIICSDGNRSETRNDERF